MEECNLIKFQLPKFGKIFYKYFFIFGQWFSAVLFVYLVSHNILHKYNLKDTLEGAFMICGFFSMMYLMAWWRFKKLTVASELTIDLEKKEFRALIYDSNKEVRFTADDVIEVGNRSGMLRFFLKDGTGIAWDKYGTDKRLLEDTIKSFGISLNSKRIW